MNKTPHRIELAQLAQTPLGARLIDQMGGVERYVSSFSQRTFSPERNALVSARDCVASIERGQDRLRDLGADSTLICDWTDKLVSLWVKAEHAGGRTLNWMITGPARFPVARNEKAMEIERRRIDEYLDHAKSADEWFKRRERSKERAALSEVAATVEHETIEANGLKLVGNKTLDRVQLIFPGKPNDELRAALKAHAFRWSPREGAWQRKYTRNGVNAAHAIKRLWLGEAA